MERVDRPNIARVRRWVWLGRKDGRGYLMADPRCRDMVLVAKGKGSWVSEEYKHDSNSFSFYIQHCGSRAILLSPVVCLGIQ